MQKRNKLLQGKKEMENEKIVKADKDFRKKILLITFLLVMAGIIFVLYFQNYLTGLRLLAEEYPKLALQRIISSMKIIIFTLMIIFAGTGIYFLRLGILTIKTSQFPPPGVKVIKDTRLSEGKNAVRKGIIIIILSMLFIISGILLPIQYYNIMRTIMM